MKSAFIQQGTEVSEPESKRLEEIMTLVTAVQWEDDFRYAIYVSGSQG